MSEHYPEPDEPMDDFPPPDDSTPTASTPTPSAPIEPTDPEPTPQVPETPEPATSTAPPAPSVWASTPAERRQAKVDAATHKKQALDAAEAAAAQRAAEHEANIQALLPLVADTTLRLPDDITAQQLGMRQAATYRLIQDEQRAAAASMGRMARLVESARLLAIRIGENEIARDNARQAASEPDELLSFDWDRIGRQVEAYSSELAAMLSLSNFATETLLCTSELLVNDLPETIHALDDGDISMKHADIIVKHAKQIPKSSRKKFEAVLVPIAKKVPIARLGEKAKAVREEMHPETAIERHKKALEKRSVRFEAGADGMATLTAYVPAVAAKGIMSRITDTAKTLRANRCPDDDRTMGQIRADVFQDLLLTGEMGEADDRGGIRARVMVMIDFSTLMGEDDKLAQLDGYGFIDADQARTIAQNSTSLYRVVYDPDTKEIRNAGTKRYQGRSTGVTAVTNMRTDPIVPNIVDAGDGNYRVPAEISQAIAIRDQRCRWMGCGASAEYCELDHTKDWALGGETTTANLAYFCKRHHRIKHNTNWVITQSDGGVLHFVSPTGLEYTTYPALTLDLIPALSTPIDDIDTERGEDMVDDTQVVSDFIDSAMGAYWMWEPPTVEVIAPIVIVPTLTNEDGPFPF